MKVIYSDQPAYDGSERPSIFLVGPTPRRADVLSWRPVALQILEQVGFQGVVLVPEPSNGGRFISYDYQVEWERAGLEKCNYIVAWVPRELPHMPALTTNVEFGYWLAKSPARLMYGRPDYAANISYLDWLYKLETGRTPFNKLEDMLAEVTLYGSL